MNAKALTVLLVAAASAVFATGQLKDPTPVPGYTLGSTPQTHNEGNFTR